MKKKIIIFLILTIALSFNTTTHSNEIEYFKERAEQVNEEWVKASPDLSYPQNVADVGERVEYLWYWTEYHTEEVDTRKAFIDIYSIIEHETRWVNYLELDEGLSFGVASMRWSTATILLEELDYNRVNWPDYALQNEPELQIRLAVYYYSQSLEEHNCRDMAIVSYNRGLEFEGLPERYNYWQEVDNIRQEIKEDIDWN